MNKNRANILLMNNEPSLTLPQNLITSQTLIDGFEAIGVGQWEAGDGGTISADTEHVKSGTQSIKLTTVTPGGSPSFNKTGTFPLSSPNMWMWIYVDDPAKISSMAFYLSSQTNLATYFQYAVTIANLVVGWNLLDISQSKWTTSNGETWQNPMRRLKMRVFNQAAQISNVSFDDWQIFTQQPAVMISFDDNRASQYTAAYPYMKSKRMRGTAYCVGTWVESNAIYFSWAQATEMAAGRFSWDIGNHSNTHPHFNTQTAAEIQAELEACQVTLDGQGFSATSGHVAYPFSEYDADVQTAMTAAGMLTGRRGVQATNTLKFMLPHQIYSLDGSTKTPAQWLTVLDDAITNQHLVCIFWHNLVESNPGAGEDLISDFQAVMDGIKARNLPALTASDILALQSGSITIST